MKLLKKIFDSEILLLVVMILAIILIGVTKAKADDATPIGTTNTMFPDFPTEDGYTYDYYTVAGYVGNDNNTYTCLILSNDKPPIVNHAYSKWLPFFYGECRLYNLNNNSWTDCVVYDTGFSLGSSFTYYYFNYDLVEYQTGSVFQLSPLKQQAFLAAKVGTLKVILTTLLGLVGLLMGLMVSWIGLRKCWIFLLKALRIS